MQYAFRGHIVVLCDRLTASDGEAFTEGIRRLGLGKIIGVRTWGGEIWLSASNTLADDGIATAAEDGVYGPEGKWLIEGHGVDPDIVVDDLPHATFAGSDAQLDAAIKYLQEEIRKTRDRCRKRRLIPIRLTGMGRRDGGLGAAIGILSIADARMRKERVFKGARKIAELASRGVVLKRKLPSQFGGAPLFVSPDSGLKYYRRDLRKVDPFLLTMAAELVRPGNVVWDIGANVGLFSFAAAGLAGSSGYVASVEPDGWLVSLLRRSASLNHPSRARVVVVPAAVSDSMGMAELHVASRARSANFIGGTERSEAGGTCSVASLTIWLAAWLAS